MKIKIKGIIITIHRLRDNRSPLLNSISFKFNSLLYLHFHYSYIYCIHVSSTLLVRDRWNAVVFQLFDFLSRDRLVCFVSALNPRRIISVASFPRRTQNKRENIHYTVTTAIRFFRMYRWVCRELLRATNVYDVSGGWFSDCFINNRYSVRSWFLLALTFKLDYKMRIFVLQRFIN